MRRVIRPLRLAALGAAAIVAGGCAKSAGPPAIPPDALCVRCSMEASSARFACEWHSGKEWKICDSIECLMRDCGPTAPTSLWLPDYDQRALHRADSLWIVKGDLNTPMGGGLVAFVDHASAEAVAASSHGRVGRWGDFSGKPEAAK